MVWGDRIIPTSGAILFMLGLSPHLSGNVIHQPTADKICHTVTTMRTSLISLTGFFLIETHEQYAEAQNSSPGHILQILKHTGL